MKIVSLLSIFINILFYRYCYYEKAIDLVYYAIRTELNFRHCMPFHRFLTPMYKNKTFLETAAASFFGLITSFENISISLHANINFE